MRTISAITTRRGRSHFLLLMIVLGLAITFVPARIASANVLGIPDSEYDALVALYNSTGGPSWTRSDGWLTSSGQWYGVTIGGGHVTQLILQNNRLTGSIPAELGNLIALRWLSLRGNQLTGAIPSSLMNLTQLQPGPSSISYNGLWTTDSALGAFLTSKFPNWNMTQTIAPTNLSARGTTTVFVSWTPIPYMADAGYYEVGVSSTPGGPYVFDSARRTISKSTSSLTVTGMPADRPQYFVVRTVTLANVNNPVQLTSGLSAQVLGNSLIVSDSEYNALVALYNSTGGPSWTNSGNWMTNLQPWYGVTTNGTHLTQMNLQNNQLTGSLPEELGALTNLQGLNLKGNQLIGAIPSSLTNLTQLQTGSSSISYNALWTTDSALATFLASKFPNWNMTQTIAPTNVSAHGTSTVIVSWTPIAYTADNGYYEVGISSTAGGPYVFDITRRTANKLATSMTVGGLPTDRPEYFVVRTVTLANGFNSHPVTSSLSAEVLANPLGIPDSEFNALVALYNSTAGQSWSHSDRWLTGSGAWYGVMINGGHVTQLNLQSNLLTGSLPPELGDLTSLQLLNVRGNQLMGAIPSSLMDLSQLLSGPSSISYNGLWTADSALATFLASKFSNWGMTQTIAPVGVSAQGTNTVVVSWTPILYSADSGYYEVGMSSTPGGPYVFSSARRTVSKSASSLSVTGLPGNVPHFFAVRTVTLSSTYNQSVLTSDPSAEATEWPGVKLWPDYCPAAIVGGIVSAVFPDCFYVEVPGRYYGIRVTTIGSTVTPGKVNLYGMLSSDPITGERCIQASSVLRTGPGEVTPLALSNANLGGKSWNYSYYSGPGQIGIPGASGLNNIGLLVRVCGHFIDCDTAVPAKWFTVDDGSAGGVKCVVPDGVSIDSGWNYVSATGVSSCEKPGGTLLRLLRVRTQADLVGYE